jgi:hypothetical protein
MCPARLLDHDQRKALSRSPVTKALDASAAFALFRRMTLLRNNLPLWCVMGSVVPLWRYAPAP